jgi:hypothetical protein
VKRRNEITARVIAVLADEGRVRLDWGRRIFGASTPSFAVSVGQLVDVAAVGYYKSDLPRHGRIVRVRGDL